MTLRDLINGGAQRVAFFFRFVGADPLESVFCDATLELVHTRTAHLTQSPIESGGVLTDHRREDPLIIRVRGVLTNTEFSALGIVNSLAGGAALDEALFGGTRARDAWAKLLELYSGVRVKTEDRVGGVDLDRICSIQTSMGLFESMILTSLVQTENAESGDSIFFEAVAHEVVFAESETVSETSEEDPAPPPHVVGVPSKGAGATKGTVAAPPAPEAIDVARELTDEYNSGVRVGAEAARSFGRALDTATGGSL